MNFKQFTEESMEDFKERIAKMMRAKEGENAAITGAPHAHPSLVRKPGDKGYFQTSTSPEESIQKFNTAVQQLTDVTVDEVMDVIAKVSAMKQAGYERYGLKESMTTAMLPRVKEYLTDAQKDKSLFQDWEWSYIRDVISPSLSETAFAGTRFAGFGPKSITMRFQKSPHTPEFGKLLSKLREQFFPQEVSYSERERQGAEWRKQLHARIKARSKK